jgi:hypothetical protein
LAEFKNEENSQRSKSQDEGYSKEKLFKIDDSKSTEIN